MMLYKVTNWIMVVDLKSVITQYTKGGHESKVNRISLSELTLLLYVIGSPWGRNEVGILPSTDTIMINEAGLTGASDCNSG